jgi:hypothetical protein
LAPCLAAASAASEVQLIEEQCGPSAQPSVGEGGRKNPFKKSSRWGGKKKKIVVGDDENGEIQCSDFQNCGKNLSDFIDWKSNCCGICLSGRFQKRAREKETVFFLHKGKKNLASSVQRRQHNNSLVPPPPRERKRERERESERKLVSYRSRKEVKSIICPLTRHWKLCFL